MYWDEKYNKSETGILYSNRIKIKPVRHSFTTDESVKLALD